MISMTVDTAKINKLKDKFAKYPPYAINKGLQAMTNQMNTPSFKQGMYPPSQAGAPFIWSSDKQRRFVFANVDLPYSRTMGLASAGEFKIDERYFTIEYYNSSPSAKYVLHPSYQIIGHRMRGWQPVNQYIVRQSGRLVPPFKTAVLHAWNELDSFMYGGGAGL